jgi:uncharacterized protein (TIGR02646 family)
LACKDRIRESLAQEQGFLCCYCMQRIRPERAAMKIEHHVAQQAPSGREHELDWKNLLGACPGNEGSAEKDQHCDTRKGGRSITLNPTDPRCENPLRYLPDGRITSEDAAIQHEIEQVLNLNVAYLCRNRKAALDAFIAAKIKNRPDAWSDEQLRRWLKELETPEANGMLMEYVQVPTYWLRKRLGRSKA